MGSQKLYNLTGLFGVAHHLHCRSTTV